MRGIRPQFESWEQFAREELRSNRSSCWSVDDVTDEFLTCADLDLDAVEGEIDREDEEELEED